MRTVSIQAITFFLATMLFVSCRKDAEEDTSIPHGGMKVVLAVSNPAQAEGGTAGATSISTVAACRFEKGVLAEVLNGLVPDSSGVCLMSFKKQEGMLYCLANVPEKVTAGRFVPGVTSLDDFLQLTASDTEMASGSYLALTGEQSIFPTESISKMQLKRTVARVDLSTSLKGVQVHRVKANRIAGRGFLCPQTGRIMPQDVQYKDSLLEFAKPLEETTLPLLYLCEQENTMLEFEIYVSHNGGMHKLRARLPDRIARNTVYTLKVRGNGAKLDVEVLSADWSYGDITESALESGDFVDAEASVLPQGVRLNNTHDTVRVSFRENTFELALSISEGASVKVNGKAQGVAVSVLPASPGLNKTVHVNVRKSARRIRSPEETVYLDIYTGQTYAGRVVLVFESHPVLLTGRLDFKDLPEYDFGEYVDGEIGVLALPEGWSATSVADAGGPWLALKPEAGNPKKMRILAGWRPNDPLADGRVQEARFILSDGTSEETYTVKRRNWGLPVVNIDGTWWCKYNLRGNATGFEDQILPKDDALPESSLYAYLQSCTEDELLGLLGHQYQGGFPQGLPLAWDAAESKFYYEGTRSSVPGFTATADSLMVPPGYRVPRKEDFQAFSQNENFNLGKPGIRSFTNAAGQQVTVTVAMRNVNFLGHNYGLIGFYEFQVGNTGDKIVLCGLGYQFQLNTTGLISPTTILLATKGTTDWCWRIMGQTSPSNPVESWISFSLYKEIQTRTLRAVKEPVEYIY